MARLEDLELTSDPVQAVPRLDELPDQPIVWPRVFQPGTYRFRLPEDLSRVCRTRAMNVAVEGEQSDEPLMFERIAGVKPIPS